MIVLGSGFGDEGKGLTTSYLCSKVDNPLVVRFNGGQQAGHTVVFEGQRHVFSQFGSGSLQRVPTYWSRFCTFYPPSFIREYEILKKLGKTPKIYVHPLCPITTYFDIDANRKQENNRLKRHGSVGMGFGKTLQRQEDFYKLYAQDLYFDNVLEQKLRNIGILYYGDSDEQIQDFIAYCKEAREIIEICDEEIMKGYDCIFEGAQGILLDMDFGFFPNVTRSNTTSKNAHLLGAKPEIYYITRTYLTRHGNGYLPGEKVLPLVNNENETNKSHAYQGEFRTAELSTELLNYAIMCDNNFSPNAVKNLVISCFDQYPIDVPKLLDEVDLEFDNVYISHGPSMDNISRYEKENIHFLCSR